MPRKSWEALTLRDESNLGRIFTTVADVDDWVWKAMEEITLAVVRLFNEHESLFRTINSKMMEELRAFLSERQELKINSALIQRLLKLQRKWLWARMNQINHEQSRELGLWEQKLDEYSVKIFSTYFRDDLLRILFEEFFKNFPSVAKTKAESKVPEETYKVIYDILRDSPLTMFLVLLKEKWLIDMSDNSINDYEYEEEVKLVNINKRVLINKLKKRWAVCKFKWIVEDTYYDYPEWQRTLDKSWWMKSTFRIRKRIHDDGKVEHFYTIKRKLSPAEEAALIERWELEPQDIKTRRCHEKELVIKDLDQFKKMVKSLWMVKTRFKKKKRESYELPDIPGIKFDFDKYKGKQDIVELEANSNKLIKQMINDKELDIKKYERMATWSTKFLKSEKTNSKKKK